MERRAFLTASEQLAEYEANQRRQYDAYQRNYLMHLACHLAREARRVYCDRWTHELITGPMLG